MRRLARLAPAAAVTLALLAGAATWHFAGEAAPARISTPSVAAAVAPNTAAHTAGRFEVGLQQRYDLHYAAEIRLGGASAPAVFALEMDTALDVTVASVAPDGAVEVEYTLRNPSFPPAADPEKARAAAAQLVRPFRARLDADGALGDVAFDPATDAATRNTLRSLAAGLQVVVPVGHGDLWTAREQDPTGAYAAEYRRTADGIEKTSKPYDRLSTPGGLVPAAGLADVRRDARAVLTLDAQERLVTLSADETLLLTVTDGVAPTWLKSSLRATRTDVQNYVIVAARAGLQRIGLHEALGADEIREADDVRRAQKMSLAEALAALRTLAPEGDPEDLAAASDLNLTLAAQLRQTPELAGRLRDEARKASAGARSILLAALSEAGTAESQVALAQLSADAELAARGRVEALGQLGLVEHPTAGTQTALQDLMQSRDPQIATTATLALGNAQRGGADPSALAALQAQLDAAQTPEARATALTALGSTGSADVLAALTDALDAQDAEVRRAAVYGLGHQDSAEAVDLLRARLTQDESANVRVEAAHALGQKTPAELRGLIEDLSQAVLHDEASDVRAEALRALAKLADGGHGDAAAVAVLRGVAEADPEDALRRAARRAIGEV